ncbi:MAG: YceD family protein [Thiomicrorhabdus sp.]|nr:YceD family protein [Thiomicrorhabdus sp.]
MKNAVVAWSINPFKLAENRAQTERVIPVAQLQRLVESLASDVGSITAKVTGSVDEDRRKILDCQITGSVQLVCQTTFDPIDYAIDRTVRFCPVMSEEAMASVPEEYEPFLFDSEELDLITLVEDELILSLPIALSSPEAPKHQSFGPVIEDTEKKPNPFAVLEGLKKNSRE